MPCKVAMKPVKSPCPPQRSALSPLSLSCLACLSFALSLTLLASPVVRADEFVNFIGMRFTDIPAGSFTMGAINCKKALRQRRHGNEASGEAGAEDCTRHPRHDLEARDDEAPPHEVSLAAFQMGIHEVTASQFRRFLQAGGSRQYPLKAFARTNTLGDPFPVVNVNWHEAQAFVRWLNQHKPASDPGVYRLPSEAEWEYACIDGTGQKYCGDNTPDGVAWNRDNTLGKESHPHAVGSRGANVFGLYDMSGNVWEWVQDCYRPNYDHAPADGRAVEEKRCAARVQRGGSYVGPYLMRAAYRNLDRPTVRYANVGFRVVRSLP